MPGHFSQSAVAFSLGVLVFVWAPAFGNSFRTPLRRFESCLDEDLLASSSYIAAESVDPLVLKKLACSVRSLKHSETMKLFCATTGS